jgi:hypothetical protein
VNDGLNEPTPAALARRLRPLQVAMALQGLVLWVPVEKLFMTQIGFDAAAVGVMAAAYAAVVPLFEVPSGILADRWSRDWIMVLASVALAASSLLGGLSSNVPMYIGAAMLLGVYFALSSGTVDSIVYDTVLEETGSNELYETWIGRVRIVESTAFVLSALAGSALAALTSARVTYFASLPFIVAAMAAFLRFDEPRLHRSSERAALGAHLATTLHAMTRQRDVVQVILLGAIAGMLAQAVFEFGPLWLVSLDAPKALYGPYWAALVSTIGVGGYLISRVDLGTRRTAVVVGVVAALAAATLTITHALVVAIVAQVLLALLLALLGIHAGRLLHDAVTSSVRAGVSSGVGTVTWMLFLPFSLLFGWLARQHGVDHAAWMLAGAAALTGALLIFAAFRTPPPVGIADDRPVAPGDLACQELVELLTDYLEGVLPAEWRAGLEHHLDECDGCTEYTRQVRVTIEALKQLGAGRGTEPQPSEP